MTKNQKVFTVIKSLFMFLIIGIIIAFPENAYQNIVLFLNIVFLFKGVSQLIYFFTMARHKVGGLSIFYKSILYIDIGLFIMSYDDAPKRIVMIYLIMLAVFSAAISIANALKGRQIKTPEWKIHLAKAIITLLLAAFCAFCIDSKEIAVILFSIYLLMNAVSGIIFCFIGTEMYYVKA